MIERIYSGSLVKFELESIMTAWCKSDSGVRQGCPLSPLLFNIYVRELGMKLAKCKQGFKYLMVNKDGVIEEKSQAGFLYADDVCIMASNEQHLQTIFDNISGYIKEYGMKINGKKSKVVCINGAKEERLQTTQPTSGGAVTVVSSCCANCVEPPRPQQWGPDLPSFGHAGHADPLDGWRCCSQKRVMSRPIQVRQL